MEDKQKAGIQCLDLHMHTTVSDGTDTPEELLEKVRHAGLELFSITDHDAVDGTEILRGVLREGDPHFLPGVEFSCRDEGGKYHILGYGYRPDAVPVRRLTEKVHSFRIEKVRGRLDRLREEYDVAFPDEEIRRLFARRNPGKPHIGNLMVQYGFAESKEKAIREFINKVHFRGRYIGPEEAITAVLESGGIPVLAHPSYGSGDELILGQEMEDRLKYLMEFGLKGVEAFYSGFTDKLISEQLRLAEKYGLYVTAGSDYHGTNKLVSLGETNVPEDMYMPDGMKKFLEETQSRFL